MARRRRGDTKWVTANGVHLWILAAELKYEDSATFWWPLYKASRSAAHMGLAWPIYLEEFEFVGLLYRSSLPTSIYRHVDSGGDLYLEYDGGALRLQPDKDFPTNGRFYQCDIGHAVLEAGLAKVTSRSFAPENGPIGFRGGGRRKKPRDRELGQQLTTPRHFSHPTPPPPPAKPVPRVYEGHPFTFEPTVKDPPYPFAKEIWANRRHTTSVPEGFVSGRYPRWPAGTGPHRHPTQAGDEFGRCSDHLCDRCYEDPNPELSPELRVAMAALEDQFRISRAADREAKAQERKAEAEYLARNPPPPPPPPPPHHHPWPTTGEDTPPPSAN